MNTNIRNIVDAIDGARKPVKVTFFKTGKGDYSEHDQFIGVPVPALRKIAKDHVSLSLPDIEYFLHSKINEHRQFAIILLVNRYKNAPEEVYTFYMQKLDHINNWNLVDMSAHYILGDYLLTRDRSMLLDMAKSPEMWERRIAIVATWAFIKQSDLDWTFRLAEILLQDSHDLIHKAVGWMLREAGKKDQQQLEKFLDKHTQNMPRTMLRYAIERFAEPLRQHYLCL